MSLRDDARACLAAALAAVAPARAVARGLRREDDAVVLTDHTGAALARHRGPVLVVGAGKAAAGMAAAALDVVGALACGGTVIAPHGAAASLGAGVALRTGAHPVPDAAGAAATATLLAQVRGADARTLVLVLLSGGASSLMVAPAPGLTLADKQAVTRALVGAGAEIAALNAVRKHCSAVKGGGLARAAAGAAGVWTLLLSDVVGDDPATIASGPTAADPSTYAGALAALARHGALAAAPAVRAHLERGRAGTLPETAKPGDAWVARVRTVVVGSNADATAAAAAAARSRSYAVAPWPRPLAGPAADAGRALARALLAAPAAGAIAVVAGGETTVRAVPGSVGGRSQHLALAAATVLDGAPAALLAAGTDGVDGPTDAAGALVDGGTLPRARSLGIDVAAALESTASHRVLDATGDLVRTGPTGTNVADLVVALRAAP